MSVLIKGIDMPTSCGTCKMHFLGDPDYVCCGITDRIPKVVAKYRNSRTDLDARKASIESVARPDWCPLIPVPPHGDLIDRDALAVHKFFCVEHDISNADGGACYRRGWDDAVDAIMVNAPTIIEAEPPKEGA